MGAGRPGEGPGPAAALGDGVRERCAAAGRWPVAAAAAAETACFWKVRAWLRGGKCGPRAALPFWRPVKGHGTNWGMGEAGV